MTDISKIILYYSTIQQVSLTDSDPSQFREFFHLSEFSNEIKQHQPLRLKKKFYEFYTAPITKFWADSVSTLAVAVYKFTWLY